MAISGQPDIFEVHVRGLYTCLIQPLGCTMGIRTVIARLSRYIENRDTLHIYELVRGLLLNPARDEARSIRRFLANGPQLRRVFDRGIVMNRQIGLRNSPQTKPQSAPRGMQSISSCFKKTPFPNYFYGYFCLNAGPDVGLRFVWLNCTRHRLAPSRFRLDVPKITSFPPPVRLDSADRRRTMPLHAIFPAASPRRLSTGY